MSNQFIKKKDNRFGFDFFCGKANIALELDGYYVWDCSAYRDTPRDYPHTAQSKSNLRNGYRHRRMFCSACGEEKGILYCDQDTGQNCAWQKGMNENMNEWLREFYPKGRNLSRVSPATLKKNPA